MRALKIIAPLVGLVGICVWVFPNFKGNSKAADSPNATRGIPESSVKPIPLPRELTPQVKALQDADWGSFRRAFPFQMQVIAVSAPYPDHSRTLIVSEPPPDVTLEGLQSVDRAALATYEVKEHTVGYDGWVKDAVFNLPPDLDDAAVTRLVQRISGYAFGTEYGAFSLKLPVNLESLHTTYPLDLRLGVQELHHWATEIPYQSTDGAIIENLSKVGAQGVYYSQQPGVVALVLPKVLTADNCNADLRRFALDSDLIVGAVKTDGKVAVLARERVVPVDVMPPLRAETIKLLAGAGTDQLAQSYERNSPFAGKFKSAWDWAPSFLSPQLIDTEYGSLLNVADQLLKSWSESGQVRYQNFNYPDPARFPFRQALSSALAADTLLFNWNTTGVGYTVDLDATTQVYGLYRTGALPVIYRPDTKGASDLEIHGDLKTVKLAEEIGYQFYCSQNDPMLARVVQYASIYQCFRAFHLQGDIARQVSAGTQQKVLDEAMRETLKTFATISEAGLRQKADDVAKSLTTLLADPNFSAGDDQLEALIAPDELQKRTAAIFFEKANSLRQVVVQFHDAVGDRGLDQAADFICAPRDQDLRALVNGWRDASDTQVEKIVAFAQKVQAGQTALNVLSQVDAIRTKYQAASSQGTNSWLHTQSIVVSCGTGKSVLSTGGHNLDAEVTRFRINSEIKPGSFNRLPDGTIELNTQDISRAREVVRLAAREGETVEGAALIAKQLHDIPARPPEPIEVALATGDRIRLGRGINSDHIPLPEGGGGSEIPPSGPPDGTPPPASDQPPEPPRPPVGGGGGGNDGFHGNGRIPPEANDLPLGFLLLEKQKGKIYIYKKSPTGDLVAETWTTHDAHIAVVNELQTGSRFREGSPLEIRFGEGYSKNEYDAFIKSLDVQLRRFPQADRVLVFRNVDSVGLAKLNTALQSATPGTFHVVDGPDGLRLLDGTLTLTEPSGKISKMSVAAALEGTVEEVSDSTVTKAISDTATRATTKKLSPKQLGIEIYNDLEKLSPGRRARNGVITVEDAGDFTIVLQNVKPFSAGSVGSAQAAYPATGEIPHQGS